MFSRRSWTEEPDMESLEQAPEKKKVTNRMEMNLAFMINGLLGFSGKF
jgi:hypothetical protein